MSHKATKQMASEHALGIAARCWCEPATEHVIMIPALAEVFSERIDGYLGLIESAWNIICNAGHGDWETQTEEWQQAAVRFRESYHAMLTNNYEPALGVG